MNTHPQDYAQPVYSPGPDPSVADVLQEAPVPVECVPVHIIGIPDVRLLPAKRSSNRTFIMPAPGVGNIVGPVIDADPRYKRVWVVATGNPVYIGTETDIKAPNGPFGFLIPTLVAVPLEGFDKPHWAVAITGAAVLTMRYEFWAD